MMNLFDDLASHAHDDANVEPSELVKASPFLMKLWGTGVLPKAELERRARGAERLKEAFSSIPFYAQRAKANPDFWNEFYDSRVNW